MPANLTPDYHRAEARFRAAKSAEERIDALEEMLRVIPKHKGTDGLQADLKARLAKLKRQPPKKAARAAASHIIPHEGAGQVALVGAANTGKSSLVARLTHAKPEVADYPFTTREATPGMMPFEDIAFQLIDLPPLTPEYTEPWVFDLVRRADLLWLVVDVVDSVDELEQTLELLEARRIEVGGEGKKALVVVTGRDKPGAAEALEIAEELLEHRFGLIPVSTLTGEGLEELARRTFDALEILRVYTKQPGKPPDREAPFTLPRGAKVSDLATRIHKDLAAQLKFARIWGPSAFDGQTVTGEHALAEGDVVELHA